MEVFKKPGTKERLLEMFEKVNKTKVVENDDKPLIKEGYGEFGHKIKNSRITEAYGNVPKENKTDDEVKDDIDNLKFREEEKASNLTEAPESDPIYNLDQPLQDIARSFISSPTEMIDGQYVMTNRNTRNNTYPNLNNMDVKSFFDSNGNFIKLSINGEEMSRNELPPEFIAWAEEKGKGNIEYYTMDQRQGQERNSKNKKLIEDDILLSTLANESGLGEMINVEPSKLLYNMVTALNFYVDNYQSNDLLRSFVSGLHNYTGMNPNTDDSYRSIIETDEENKLLEELKNNINDYLSILSSNQRERNYAMAGFSDDSGLGEFDEDNYDYDLGESFDNDADKDNKYQDKDAGNNVQSEKKEDDGVRYPVEDPPMKVANEPSLENFKGDDIPLHNKSFVKEEGEDDLELKKGVEVEVGVDGDGDGKIGNEERVEVEANPEDMEVGASGELNVDAENIEADNADEIPLPGSGEDEAIEGGLADGKEPMQYDNQQIIKGMEVEMEHTDDPKIALEIAMDHLEEIPNYYDHLDKMEKEAMGEPATGEEVEDAMGDGQEGEAAEEIPNPEETEKEVLWGKVDTFGEPEEDEIVDNYSPKGLGEANGVHPYDETNPNPLFHGEEIYKIYADNFNNRVKSNPQHFVQGAQPKTYEKWYDEEYSEYLDWVEYNRQQGNENTSYRTYIDNLQSSQF